MPEEQTTEGQAQDDEQLVAEAQAEAAEVKADIKEAKEEAAEARKEGDTDRADKLEARIDALTTDLGDVKSTLDRLAKRPFAPAPAPKSKPEVPAEAADQTPAEEKPRDRVHRFGSRRWFGDRAYED